MVGRTTRERVQDRKSAKETIVGITRGGETTVAQGLDSPPLAHEGKPGEHATPL